MSEVDITQVLITIIVTAGTIITTLYTAKYASKRHQAKKLRGSGLTNDGKELPQTVDSADIFLAVSKLNENVKEIRKTVDCIDDKVQGCIFIHYRTAPEIAETVFRGRWRPPTSEGSSNLGGRRPRGPTGQSGYM